MLSATDVHLLVGFLTAASTPDSVEIELGAMVHDVKAQENRDVDVTAVVKKESGIAEAFAGIEVKNEARPLDVIHVEQLAKKLLDMPALTRRAIVSSSGYSGPARNKARADGIELWNLRPWTENAYREESRITEVRLVWQEQPFLRFNPNDVVNEDMQNAAMKCIPLETVQNLLRNAEKNVSPHAEKFLPGVPTPVNLYCTLEPPIFVDLEEVGACELHDMLITGILTKVENQRKVEMKALVRDGDEWPYATCLLAELSEGHLMGIFIGQRSVNLNAISVSLRNQKVLRRLRLREHPQPKQTSI